MKELWLIPLLIVGFTIGWSIADKAGNNREAETNWRNQIEQRLDALEAGK